MNRPYYRIADTMSARIGRRGGLSLLLMAAALTAHADTYTVTTTEDKVPSVPGSLRWAIEQSNATPLNPDVIAFNIPGVGSHTITLQRALPALTDAVTIDGYTQPGARPNTEANGNNAVLQIVLDGSGAGGGVSGLSITEKDTSTATRVKGLVIQNFKGDGILLGGNGGNVISGNFIGTDPTGQMAQGNRRGIRISRGSSGNAVGGTTPQERNVISGSTASGIYIDKAHSTVVEGNFIGTDKTGNAPLGNTHGMFVVSAQATRIGGTTPQQRNVISGNKVSGISSVGGLEQSILGNFIGTNVAGTGVLGNGGTGIVLGKENQVDGERNTVIGQTTAGAGNRIAHNKGAGVIVDESMSIGNEIRGNSIFKNGGLGIDLKGDGVTGNDAVPDADTGPNRLQNFPILTDVKASGAGIKVSGFLHSVPNKTFYLDFYANEVRDPSGHGEGQFYLDTLEVTTDAQGQVNFVATLPASSGPWIAATATLKGANANTSEFSPFVARQGREFGVNNTNSRGPESLAQAITDSNANGNPDEVNLIVFHIPGNGPHHILFPPMDIHNPVTIDGSSQPGARRNSASNSFNGEVSIVLEGSVATGALLFVTADHVTLRGLSIINTQPANQAAAILSFGNDLWVTGSLIGLQPDGAPAPNGFGMSILGADSSIGGPRPEDRNAISAHPLGGVGVVGSRNIVQNNLIGTDLRGTRNRGNGAWGVSTAGNGKDIIITKNVIAFNASGGVQIISPHTMVSQNRIFNNGGLGIDRSPTGVNLNVPQGAQNHSVLESATVGDGTTITGTLNSTPKTAFRVEFFKSPRCDSSGSGEGKTFLGKRLVKTNATGNVAFWATLPASVSAGQAITATAIDPSGKTSEFSQCMTALES